MYHQISEKVSEFSKNREGKSLKVRKAIIPAAGLGTRFLPATKAMPKEMLPILDKPTIQYIIEEAIASGIEEILIVTGKSKRAIEDHFDRSFELESELEKQNKLDLLELVQGISNMIDIHYIRQKEPKGLGHAIYCARTFVGDEPFAVLLGDDIVHNEEKPCLQQMLKAYEEYGTSILGVQEVEPENVHKYGIVAGEKMSDHVYSVHDLVEKPALEEAPSNVAILGRYIINPSIFAVLEHTPPGKGGEIQLTDALRELAQYEAMFAYQFEGRRYDVGNKLGYLEATVEAALRRQDIRGEFLHYLMEVVEKDKG
ncbi:UTP--glucose-1-phosphate uridylyltransferase GalU [Bacillus sp. SD088]|nr:UTP--glucose-1-phosphate uridylyltransferase GalU [Bacillus sp. SD088]